MIVVVKIYVTRFPRGHRILQNQGVLFITSSIGAWHPQDMLPKIVEGHLLRDRRDLVQTDLAVEAFHIKLAGVAKATKGLDSMIHSITAGVPGEEFGNVGFLATGETLVIEPGSLERHEFGRFQARIRLGERKLYPLILANRAPKDHTLFGVLHGLLEGCPANPDRFCRNHDTLRVQTINEMVKTFPFLAH